MEGTVTFVGLDVHKKSIAVAAADGGIGGEVRYLGVIDNTTKALDRLIARLERPDRVLRFCYEAGPCGYCVYRHLQGRGYACMVVAPSLIPRRPGERVKTDRRDAAMLARLLRAGELTAEWVSDADHEAMRTRRRARQRLSGFLLRHGRVRSGKNWPLPHRRWLSTVRFDHPAQQIVLQELIDTVDDADARCARLVAQIEALVPQWSMAPVVEALQAMRGIALIVAVTLVAVAVNSEGRREVLGFAIGPSEAETFWTDFLRSLTRRGLRGVKLVISDAHEGLKAAVAKVLNATWQRCRVHFMRNALAHVAERPINLIDELLPWTSANERAAGA